MAPKPARCWHLFGDAMLNGWLITMCRPLAQAKKHLSAEFLATADEAGITIKHIDIAGDLEAQGPFDAILHKARRNPGECGVGAAVGLGA